MKRKVQINDNSIETAGLPTDYKEAICEFIWNAFDANATSVKIEFDNSDIICGLPSFSIIDDGEGIFYSTLNKTFGAFLDSQKKRDGFIRSSNIHGKKGKGRFSFEVFSTKATWKTVYENNGLKEFEIVVDAQTKDFFDSSDEKDSNSKKSGTTVLFENIHTINSPSLQSEEFKNFLKFQFGWFLHLNKDQNYQIFINDKRLDYETIIADSDTIKYSYKNAKGEGQDFNVNYIRWHNKIDEKFYFYYLNEEKLERGKRLTSFNNKGDEFYHSVYVESPYFNDFILAEEKKADQPLLSKNQTDEVFRNLSKDMAKLLTIKRRNFIRENSEKIISKFEDEGVLPSFSENKYDQTRKDDFEEVVKEIYSIEPKIFIGLGKEQKKTFLGMLNLILDTDERDNIMKIIDSVVNDLGPEERASLAEVLKKTNFSKIVKTIKLIEQRYEKIEALKALVFDLQKFTTERDQIQLIVQENYWLFGEQYNLVSADINFEKSLSEYLYILDGESKKKVKLDSSEKLRRPDIFICRKRMLPNQKDVESEIEENIILELKAPAVSIGKKEHRQIQDYLDVIIKEPRFNSQTRKWKFILISTRVDEDIKQFYKTFEDKGRMFLVHLVEKYEIYIMTWDDVFRNFEIRHRYLLDKLEFDKTAIQEELKLQGISLDKESSKIITDKILSMKS
jgi:hypothetical protein